MDYRTPIARARGLGAAHHGSGHWWWQRLTALALLPLGLWFLFCLSYLPDADYQTVRTWFRHPINSALTAAFTVAVFYHAALGLRVILEDYVHSRWLKFVAITLVQLLLALGGLTTLFALLHLLINP